MNIFSFKGKTIPVYWYVERMNNDITDSIFMPWVLQICQWF